LDNSILSERLHRIPVLIGQLVPLIEEPSEIDLTTWPEIEEVDRATTKRSEVRAD